MLLSQSTGFPAAAGHHDVLPLSIIYPCCFHTIDVHAMQIELDGQGSLQITGDSAVVTVFEFKSSLAGAPALPHLTLQSGRVLSHLSIRRQNLMHPVNASKTIHPGALQLYGSTLTTCFSAGMAKGKQQLRMRLEMLLWAITHSRAIPSHTTTFLRGKGYLFFPKSSSVRILVTH